MNEIGSRVRVEWKGVISEGEFLSFGMDYVAEEYGVGNYSTVIVRLDDGRMINPAASDVEFIDEEPKTLPKDARPYAHLNLGIQAYSLRDKVRLLALTFTAADDMRHVLMGFVEEFDNAID